MIYIEKSYIVLDFDGADAQKVKFVLIKAYRDVTLQIIYIEKLYCIRFRRGRCTEGKIVLIKAYRDVTLQKNIWREITLY